MGFFDKFSTANGLVTCSAPVDTVPPRPNWRSKEMYAVAFEKMREKFVEYLEMSSDDDISELRDEILASADAGNGDGYAMCRDLEDSIFCEGSVELCEICEDFYTAASFASDAAIKEWVKTYGIAPLGAIGQPVELKRWPNQERLVGTIVKIYEDRAQYIVGIPSLGHKDQNGYVLGFENPELLCQTA